MLLILLKLEMREIKWKNKNDEVGWTAHHYYQLLIGIS